MPAQPPPLSQIRAGAYELVLDVARASVTECDVESLLRRVCLELAEVCGLAGCAAAVLDGATGSIRALVGSSPEVEQLTRLVRQLGGQDSGAAAWRALPFVAATNLTGARTVLAEAAGKVGLPVTASITLRGVAEPVGFLQLFGPDEASLSETMLRELLALADVLGSTLHDAGAYEYSAELVAKLSEALDTQRPIEQAKGLLAERHRIDLDAAYRMLREQARRRGLSATQVASEVVGRSWHSTGPAVPLAEPPTGPVAEADPESEDEPASGELPEPGGTPLPEQRSHAKRSEPERHTLF